MRPRIELPKVKPGFVRIGQKEYYCGIRVLTKEEAKQNNGFPFDIEELKSIAASDPKEDKALQNRKTLAILILENMESSPIGSFAKTEEVRVLTPEQLKNKYPHAAKTEQSPHLAGFHRGDIVGYVERLKQQYPDQQIGILNPANSQFLGGFPFVGASALEEFYIYSSKIVFAYVQNVWEHGFSYKDLGDRAYPAYAHKLEKGTAWSTDNIEFLQKPGKAGYTKLEKPFSVSVVASAAPSYPSVAEAQKNAKRDEARIRNEIRAQLTAFVQNGTKIPVLVAFGCGVFNNDPALMAKYYFETLYQEGYADFFNRVDFAIPGNAPGGTFDIFIHTFNELTKNQKNVKVGEVKQDVAVFHEPAPYIAKVEPKIQKPQIPQAAHHPDHKPPQMMQLFSNALESRSEVSDDSQWEPEKYMTDKQKQIFQKTKENQKTVKIYYAKEYKDKINPAFNKPGNYPLHNYFLASDKTTKVMTKEVADKLAKQGVFAPEYEESGTVESRQYSKFRVIASNISSENEQGEIQSARLITANAPNFMGTSPFDEKEYLNKDGSLNVEKYQKTANTLAILILLANEGKPSLKIAEFGLGVYLNVFKDPAQKERARKCMYTAFAAAAQLYNVQVNWLLYAGDKGQYTASAQARADLLNITYDFGNLKFSVGDILEATNSVNNGSDRTIGGKYSAIQKGSKKPTTEEEVSHRTDIMLVQTTLNPHFPKDPYKNPNAQCVEVDIEAILPKMRPDMFGHIALGEGSNHKDRHIHLKFSNKDSAEYFAKNILAKQYGIYKKDAKGQYTNEPKTISAPNSHENMYIIRMDKEQFDLVKGPGSYNMFLLAAFKDKYHFNFNHDNLAHWQAQATMGGEKYVFEGQEYKIPRSAYEVFQALESLEGKVTPVEDQLATIVKTIEHKVRAESSSSMGKMFRSTETKNMLDEAVALQAQFAHGNQKGIPLK